MKATPVDQLVYQHMFPKPRASDPQNFHALLQRHLIIEVRSEVHAFYGHLDTPEAKYPGLDYTHPIHRIRLSRWQWHRRLFRAFDNLRLTDNEIANLTKWEGTKWAKERFEREQGITIRDTASDGIADWVEPEDRPVHSPTSDSPGPDEFGVPAPASGEDVDRDDDDDDDRDRDRDQGQVQGQDPDLSESDEDMESVGAALHERLRERVARREAGDTSTVLDEEWEQWLKNAIESGTLPHSLQEILQQTNHVNPARLLPPSMLSAARAGNWEEVPQVVHNIVRQALSLENPDREAPSTLRTTARRPVDERRTSGHWRRSYSDLRLPGGESNHAGSSEFPVQRTAEAPGA